MNYLTPREKQIARLVSNGCNTKSIAKELSLKETTIKRHKHNIFLKFGVTNSIELAVIIKAPLNSPFRKLIEDKNIGEL
jgi:DNA-binding NarL/FixJ family response regulator